MKRFLKFICVFGILVGIITPSYSQIISGKVVNKRSKPIPDATVSLKIKGNSTKTDADGNFSLNATGVITSFHHNTSQRIMIIGRSIVFYTPSNQQVSFMLFTTTGKRAGRVFTQKFPEGTYGIELSNIVSFNELSNSIYILKATIGKKSFSLPISPLSSFNNSSKEIFSSSIISAEKLVTKDTLVVSKDEYITFTKALDSDVSQDVGTIQLNLVNDPDAIIEKKVDSLLALMTVEEKIAQTVQMQVDVVSPEELKKLGFGSIFNGGDPHPDWREMGSDVWSSGIDKLQDGALQSRLRIPFIYGIDAVHGVALVKGATIFPHNIGLGCTGDTALVAKAAHITAKECRAAGIALSYSPAVSVVRDERWGRSYEGFGETPEINSLMGAAYVRGLQGYGDLSAPYAVAACAKHFLGDGGTTDGVNIGVTELSEETMRKLHLPPYEAIVSEGVSAIMPSFTVWKRNGTEIKCTVDKYLLTDLLKNGLKWDGFCLSDWDAIPQAFESERYTYKKEFIEKAVNAGIDMAMISKYHPDGGPSGSLQHATDYTTNYKALTTENSVSIERLNDAVRRILRIKFRLNLFENSKSNPSLRAEFGSAQHRAVARECVRKSLVLLKNDGNVLPLKKSEKIVVVGKWANSLGAQCGGWTISWQGSVDNPSIVGTTIFKGLQEVGGTSNVTYDEKGDNIGDADKIILVLGEIPYSEGFGDHGSKSSISASLYRGGKISIHLADCPNYDLLDKCVAKNKPVILILISGRPLIIKEEDLNKIKALVAAWLPGSEGGGVADVLYGDYNFTGKLTHTWPRTFEQIPINSGTQYADEKKGSSGIPLFEYGSGLTY